ncbi:S-adenosyl-L-methionine-dependent methyltransferase [Stachybotrys elegans]|uniref:catechol O-methyltransferase n=1 Tax=Stachybotrys elegans TaxID=80388 RepID=A0A8K0SR32_9HYPO|nr:S-adenosyl-L-methionine-dependent methyltransferase [Stachybotrys elegans]
MAPFDPAKAYAVQEDVFFDDGREIELLHYIYARPDLDAIRGSPERVLAAIDEYGRTRKYLMNVGELKGKIVTDLIRQTRPNTMVELGGYVGYSCILFGHAVRQAGGQQYLTLERNPEFAAVIGSLVDLAGLSSIVKVVVGPSDASLRRLCSAGALPQGIDVLFLDHYKPAYLPDLKLCEQLGLVRRGSVLAADNVVAPGNPPYLAYVRGSVEDKLAGKVGAAKNGFGDRTAKQYEKREGEEVLDEAVVGDPRLEYVSDLWSSFEPTGVPDGVEITRCVGRREDL